MTSSVTISALMMTCLKLKYICATIMVILMA